MCVKKTWFTENQFVKTSHDFWKLFQQPILKTHQTIHLLNVLKQVYHVLCFKTFTKLFGMFSKLAAETISKSHD